MTLAAKHMDPVVGIDMHMVLPPPPAPPVMLPVPFVGYLIDPADYAGGCTIHVNGLPRARAGTPGMGCPPHVPPGGMFVKPPTNECEMYQGSSTVVFDGDAASAMGHQVLGCHDVGMVAPVRGWKQTVAKSLMMGSCSVIPIGGAVTLIGGASTVMVTASSSLEECQAPGQESTHIELQVYDTLGEPYADREFKLWLPNGDTEIGRLDAHGRASIDNVPHGHALLHLPDFDNFPQDHRIVATSPSSPGSPRSDGRTAALESVPNGLQIHMVQRGETLHSIAMRHGIPCWRRLYDHPANTAIRAARPNPHILLPGDVIHIIPPEHPATKYRRGGSSLSTRTPHHILFLDPEKTIAITLTTRGSEPLANVTYKLTVGRTTIEGRTDDRGRLTARIPLAERRGTLEYWPNPTERKFTRISHLELDGIDPLFEEHGVKQRLKRIGLLPDKISDISREDLRITLDRFQRLHGLAPTGVLDDMTLQALAERTTP